MFFFEIKMALLSDCWKIDVCAFFVGFLTILFIFTKRTYSYWDRKGFKTLPGFNYYFGNLDGVVRQNAQFGIWLQKLYNSTKQPFIGIYGIYRPLLLVRDPELIKSILIKDFSYFHDRGVHSNEEYDPLSGNLFRLTGQKWRNMRSKLSPAFSSGKLKSMFSTITDCGVALQNHLDNLANNGKILDVPEVAACFTTNVIASVAFGIEIDSIANPNNEFRVCGRKIFEPSISNIVRVFLAFVQPKLMSILPFKCVESNVEKFIKSVVSQNLDYREQNNVSRKDFFQLLIQLRNNNGTVQLDDQWETVIKADENQKTLTLDEIAAQTFIFFAGIFLYF